MSGILKIESLTKGNTLRQGDLTLLKYRLFDADGDKLDISGKPATVRLMKNNFTFIAYEKEGLTVAPDDTISFNINKILPAGIYHLEVIVDDKYIFPSRDDEGKLNVDKSSLGADVTIVEATGVEAVARKATGMMKQDEEFIDGMIANVISDTNVGNIEEYYNQFNEATTEFESLKTQALNSVTKSDKAIVDSASAKLIAQGIDAKATNALSLSESADTLSKNVQNEFNQIITGITDKDIVSAPEILGARGGFDTLGERLNDTSAQLTQTTNEIHLATFERLEGETDDNGIFNRAIASMKEGETLVAKRKDDYYYLTDTVVIDKKINIRIEDEVVYGGPKDRPIFWGKNLRHNNVYIYSIHDVGSHPGYGAGYPAWQHDEYIGFKATNFIECNLEIEKIMGTSIGYEVHALDGIGTMFSNFKVRRVFNCRIALQLHTEGVSGWMNSNYFYDLSHGFSGAPYISDPQEKYTVFQKLSNGNNYGGNSNMFIHFKFEMGSMVQNWTFVHFSRQIGSRFENYRYEVSVTNPTQKFAVFDLEIDQTINGVWNGSKDNVFNPVFVMGSASHKIHYENIKNLTTDLDKVAYVKDVDKHPIYNVYNVQNSYRKPSNNQNLIKGFYFTPTTSVDFDNSIPNQYDDRDLLSNDGVNISVNSRMVLYISNLSIGDTIQIKTMGHKPTVSVKPFASGHIVEGGKIGDVTVLSADVYYSEGTKSFTYHGQSYSRKFSVSHENVDSVILNIAGMFSGIEISSTNPENKVFTNTDATLSKENKFYFNAKPTLGDAGYWQYGEVVYNTDKTAGKDIGWVFKGGTTWESIGLR